MSGAMTEQRFGLAICKGTKPVMSKGSPWESLCQKWAMCPRCEATRASRRASKLSRRIETEYELAEGDLSVGVLTWTLPGRNHPIRRGTLREQYDYATARVRFKGEPGDHSMRGLNRTLASWGARGGTHFLEFTWNSTKGWWNLHGHTLFWAWTALDHLPDTSTTVVNGRVVKHRVFENDDDLLGSQVVHGKRTRRLPRLGFGERYSLDYAEEHELEASIRYSSKVAYTTKPFKAPKAKALEIGEFLQGDIRNGITEPRLARPFGEATKPMVQNVFDGWL